METIDQIPITKIQRATKIVKTGAKVGVNYIKYFGNRITQKQEQAKKTLDDANADDIYDGLKNLKGSALKVAQMLSMEKSIMPATYVEKFSLSQFSVPPLSPALVNKTFRKYFGKSAHEIFDKFDATSLGGNEDNTSASKIQYLDSSFASSLILGRDAGTDYDGNAMDIIMAAKTNATHMYRATFPSGASSTPT